MRCGKGDKLLRSPVPSPPYGSLELILSFDWCYLMISPVCGDVSAACNNCGAQVADVMVKDPATQQGSAGIRRAANQESCFPLAVATTQFSFFFSFDALEEAEEGNNVPDSDRSCSMVLRGCTLRWLYGGLYTTNGSPRPQPTSSNEYAMQAPKMLQLINRAQHNVVWSSST